jgi:hypothetical protein
MIILKLIFKKGIGGMGRIDLAHDKDMWLALVHAVMNLRVTQNAGSKDIGVLFFLRCVSPCIIVQFK